MSFQAAAKTNADWKDTAKDAWIDGKAEATLLFDKNLNSFDINTDVDNGVILLTGKVDNNVDKSLAGELLKNIDGVKKVDNRLTVVNSDDDSSLNQTLVDSKVATVVKSSLLLEPEVNGTDINVDVDDGVVTLKGTAESASMKDLAITIAKNTSDVKNVVDNIEVVTQ
ncbi:BON domain-containing protein [Vibrio viridaestus]|uniref:BON domain-containing protein n=2 Tax=Vibrio viridaestus TaxID=2487322 RepID=A0A3N9TH39_9VIBR|nr:BON domain-containing protein [Vibrio viridaestus]